MTSRPLHSGTVDAIGTRGVPAGKKFRLEAQRTLDGFSYTITRDEVVIHMPIQAHVKAKQVAFKISSTSGCLQVTVRACGVVPL